MSSIVFLGITGFAWIWLLRLPLSNLLTRIKQTLEIASQGEQLYKISFVGGDFAICYCDTVP